MAVTPDKEKAGPDSVTSEPAPDVTPPPAEGTPETAGPPPEPSPGAQAASPAAAPPAEGPAAAAEPATAAREGPAVEAAAATAAPPWARRHHWIVRVTHWVNAIVLVGMVASGLQIYGAYERFGIRGTRLPLPNPMDMHQFPKWMRLGGWLAGGINWHFFLMWPLVLNGLVYLGYLVLAGEWRPLLFRPRDVGPAIEMQKYYLRLRRDHPPQGKHNALQKGAYTFIVLLGMLSVLTGLSLWKPVQLWWLTAAFGGYELARYWHFVAVWLFVAFSLVHVVLVFLVDPASLRAMLTGWYRGNFPSHD